MDIRVALALRLHYSKEAANYTLNSGDVMRMPIHGDCVCTYDLPTSLLRSWTFSPSLFVRHYVAGLCI